MEMEECLGSLVATIGGEWRIEEVDQASTGRLPMDLLRIVIAISLPPLGVFLQVGDRQALLDQRRADDPRLHTGDNPRDLGHRQILIWESNGGS